MGLVTVRYSLRVVGIRTKFYEMAAYDPVTTKILLLGLERRMDIPRAEENFEMMDKRDTHLNT